MSVIEKIQMDAFQRMSWVNSKATNLYIEERPIKAGGKVNAYQDEISIDQDTIMVFADEAPIYNWAHPCRYLLYNSEDGQLYDEVNANFPPYLTKTSETFKAFHEPVRVITEIATRGEYVTWASKFGELLRRYDERGKRYAVLFSGASNNRHLNDLEFLYRTLIDVYEFSPNNIHVLNYDGTINYSGYPQPTTSWPGDNTAYQTPVNGPGTKQEFENVLDNLKNVLDRHDLLLIHTNNHGGHNGTESYLCTYSGPSYKASDFSNKMNELPEYNQLMVMMEQCHSGGFNNPIISKSTANETSVASACAEDKSSIGGPDFDPFARDWISAMNGSDPYGNALAFDPNIIGDSVIAASEAYNYADTVKDPYDTPVYHDTPVGCGDTMHLGEPPRVLILDRILEFLKYYELRELPRPIPIPGPDPGPRVISRARASRNAAIIQEEIRKRRVR
jgi:hypothetical protein